jgi:PBP1b-binding outer membrane lipoprotein LpoB
MKKIAIIASVIASALVLASCASKGTMDQSTTAASSTQTSAAPAAHHHRHHDYKGESATK